VRSADVVAPRLHAIKAATPWTTDAGVIAPHAVLVQALVTQLRGTLEAIATFANALAQRAQRHPACPLFQALPGAGPVFAARLLVAFGAQRARSPTAAAWPK
jgi:transposase